ncbi:retrovirus-related pol polyprotein from transposon TNT 1-94 [Tanacetum coccineum]
MTQFTKKKSVSKTNESEGLSKPVTSQNLPQTASQAIRNINVIKPGMYQIESSKTQTRAPQLTQTSRNTNPHVSTSTRVAHRNNVSRPQPRSNQIKDKVMPNTSHVKFKKIELEEHPRISSISNQTKSVTACNDSLTSRTSNVNAVCATCGKYVFNSNHDACVSKYLNDVNARTKKPKVVPIKTTSSTLICLMAKASPTQAWLWHQRLSHLNFDYINLLLKKDVVIGLPKLKYVKDQLCSSCEASDYDNTTPSTRQLQNVSPSVDTTVPSQQELDIVFGLLYDEFFNTGTSRVNKSSSPTDNSAPQGTYPLTNIQPTSEPTTLTNAHAEENNDN